MGTENAVLELGLEAESVMKTAEGRVSGLWFQSRQFGRQRLGNALFVFVLFFSF